jgi:hypothetical protein
LSGNMLRATVHAMRKVPCTEITGAPVRGGFGGATEEWCLEYELRTESVSYVIRPHHMILLLLGGMSRFGWPGANCCCTPTSPLKTFAATCLQ